MKNKKNVIEDMIIYEKNNNLEHKDNLNDIPEEPAVYGIFARINGKPENCRLVSYALNLRKAVRNHFSKEEKDSCIRYFMNSIKIKTINYHLVNDMSKAEIEELVNSWIEKYDPTCSEELNEVF